MLKLIYSIGFTIFILASSFAKLYASDITAQQLRDEIITRKAHVTQLNQISELAQKFGIKVYLMGGLASSFAHYVHLDLRRESGEKKFRDDYFGYFWNQVFRESQDIDLAVDLDRVSAEQLNSFKSELKNIFGEKKVDLHPLKESPLITDKTALSSPDFKNQHSDSASNGLIEITGSEVLDLRSGDSSSILSSSLPFLETMTSGTLHYLESPLHATTARAQQGLNPQLLSIIRYFINLSRYNLSPDASQVEMINRILLTTDVSQITGYALNWVENNAKKMITQAYDLERTYKLIHKEHPISNVIFKIPQLSKKEKTTHWWLSRRVLSSNVIDIAGINKPPTGRTAKDLDIRYLGHATNQSSYLQISYNPEGIPNFILSVSEGSQHAKYGEGLYTQKGEYGWKNFGDHHVRLEIIPEAKEGTDFSLPGGDVVLVYDRSKIRVQFETGDHFRSWLEAIVERERNPENTFKVNEKASRIDRYNLTEEQMISLIEKVEALLAENKKFATLVILNEIYDQRLWGYKSDIQSHLRRKVLIYKTLAKLLLSTNLIASKSIRGSYYVLLLATILPTFGTIVSAGMLLSGVFTLHEKLIITGVKSGIANLGLFIFMGFLLSSTEKAQKYLEGKSRVWRHRLNSTHSFPTPTKTDPSEIQPLPMSVSECINRLSKMRRR